MVTEELGIELNRGVTMRMEPESGIRVCMYKDEPGAFYDLKGRILPESFARKAGFDIKELGKQKQYNKALRGARDALNDEYSGIAEQEVLEEIGEFKTIKCAHGNADVYRGGDKMNSVAIKANEAIALVKQLSKQDITE